MTDDLTRRAVIAHDHYEAYRAAAEDRARIYKKLLRPCPGNCPVDYPGHWRDWHKGHGCDADIRGNRMVYLAEIARERREAAMTGRELRVRREQGLDDGDRVVFSGDGRDGYAGLAEE